MSFSRSEPAASDSHPPLGLRESFRSGRWIGKSLLTLAAIWVFLMALEVVVLSFQQAGSHVAADLVSVATNPFISLFVGLLATALVQSSSTTTTLIVSIVAAGGMTVSQAVPMIMGANIGTAMTSTLVALGYIGDRREFEKAVGGATLHDLFNILTASVLLIIEMLTGALSHAAVMLAEAFGGQSGLPVGSLVIGTKACALWLVELFTDTGFLRLVLAVGTLWLALRLLIFTLRRLWIGQFQRNLSRILFGHPVGGLVSGMSVTAVLQSSSLTTSLMVPLIVADKVSLRQAFPFLVGANIGTTATALLAALVTQGNEAALAVAFTHLLFNLFGMILLLPHPAIRKIPIFLAAQLGKWARVNRLYGVIYVVGVFFILPFSLIIFTVGVSWLQ